MTPSGGTKPDVSPAESTPPVVHVQQHEYGVAAQSWYRDAIYIAAGALDPVYEQISWRRMEAITETVATVSDSEQLVLQASTMSAGTEIKTADIIEFRLPAIHEGIIEMAEQFVKQTLASFIETITQITDKTGNTVQSEDPIEGLIMAIEDLEMEFDDDGRPTTQIIVHPDTYKKFEEAEQTASPELLDKLAKILERKRKEYIASRRSRQLPRLSY